MRLVSLWAGALPLFAATAAQAQLITPVEGTRSVSAYISATDSVTNVVQGDSHRTNTFEPFTDSIILKANTHAPSRVDANGTGAEQSTITGSRITASISATAQGVSQDASARGHGEGNADFYLTFNVSRASRYVAKGTATANATGTALGGSTSLLYIANLDSGTPILSIDIGHLDGVDSVNRRGWLPAGPYTLQGDTSALVDAKNSLSGSASASWTLDFQLFCPADYDVNGTVNTTDRDAFLTVWQAGQPDADMDGNGTVNTADKDAFLAAYNAGC